MTDTTPKPRITARPLLWGPRSALVLSIAAIGLALDQATKLWLLFVTDLPSIGRIELLPFLDLTMVWNYGISYGLFQQGSPVGRIALIVLTLAATVFLWIWGARAKDRLSAVSLGLIVGGAIGNGIDRIAYGAVADFFHFHVGTFSWYVFNPADAWIVAGVAGLMYDSFVAGPKEAALQPHAEPDEKRPVNEEVAGGNGSRRTARDGGMPVSERGIENDEDR
ncbi:signal peptidase II [Stappia sp. F7233]|uniref:Lipoprotein signal peptidase n=1 Tax=Stappia albiluteola TaxID=2758565 RepID=A0A839AKM9_9HYPH|nr:signal peptidase II [Stappia albiluteola]MBA5779009.1 signal peptidase II [Stappia albiluteola]